ncbi:MAG: iron-containing alcohol dehydrogenase [Treponemataceae bacterium]|nr:iron-containing alcohol dehydrogenase [Treponemataceae bacterium]
MADFTFRISPNIVLGSYTVSRLGEFAVQYGKRCMLVLDPALKQTLSAEQIMQSLKDRGIEFFVFEGLADGATTMAIQKAVVLARQSHVQCVVGAGGGRAMNVARAVAAIFYEAGGIYEFAEGKAVSAEPLPLICLPTTTRDPFVFTDSIPITDSRAAKIKLIKARNGLCRLVLFDPNLTTTLDGKQTAAITLETLCLASEAYLSQKANFFSDMIAEKSVSLLGAATDKDKTTTDTTPTEELLTQGGCMASLAVAASALGAASLLALCISARFKADRALVTAILFPHVLEDCATFKSDRVAALARILNAAPADSAPEAAANDLIQNIRGRLAEANLPANLKDLNLSMEQLALAAEDAGKLAYVNALPRSMTSDDLFSLIKKAY